MNNLSYNHVDITGGFWEERQRLVRETTVCSVYRRFCDTGRFDAFRLDWKEGMPNRPHFFWDSDVAKWIQGAAYLTAKKREPELERIIDEVVGCIRRGRMEDGYFNIYFELFEPQNRFTKRGFHELYCLGHLIEAGVAYYEATGKRELLSLCEDYADLVRRIFTVEQSAAFDSPGHEEVELALVKLYDCTGKREYLDLARFFIDKRGSQQKLPEGDNYNRGTNIQDHLPVREQFTAEGHAVRACYLYCAMADLALRDGDKELEYASERLFDNITNAKMYITGSVGSTHVSEAFEEDYQLPNNTAYAETCACIGLALFAQRMQLLKPDSKYADTVERVIYNGFLSGLSLDGKSFFYENPQEIDLSEREEARGALCESKNRYYPPTRRSEVFDCSCCPPNVVRFMASLGDFLYGSEGGTVCVYQYMTSRADFGGFTLEQTTDYPYDGKVRLKLNGGDAVLALRIPGWCTEYSITINGKVYDADISEGFARVPAKDGDAVELNMTVEPRFVYADPRVAADRGQRAVAYGPLVMCLEGVDNGGTLSGMSLLDGGFSVSRDEKTSLPTVFCPAVRVRNPTLYSSKPTSERFEAKLIPYFALANREECDMKIWTPFSPITQAVVV